MSSVSPTHQDLSNDTTFSQIKSCVPVPLRHFWNPRAQFDASEKNLQFYIHTAIDCFSQLTYYQICTKQNK